MKLLRTTVRQFRNFIDSSLVEMHPQITCLVGKNESGKTAFVQALYRLNPARPNAVVSVPEQYPAWLEKRDRLQGKKLEEVRFVEAIFKLDDSEKQGVAEQFANGVLLSDEITVARNYKNELSVSLLTNESACVAHVLSEISLPSTIKGEIESAKTFANLASMLTTLEKRGQTAPDIAQAVPVIKARVEKTLRAQTFAQVVEANLRQRIPQFFYFADYSSLPYSVKIRELLTAKESDLSDDLLTARSLLKMAGAEQDYLLNSDYERRKRELENVANALTQDVLKYWTQNPELRVSPDITQSTEVTPNGQQSVIDELKIRIWDQRHTLSLPFTEHSSGFRWFFSFLAAFSEYEFRPTPNSDQLL